MINSRCIPPAVACVLSGLLISAAADKQNPTEGLPGAKSAVFAQDYGSVQEAINALPADGGVVHLPAGTFEIDQPLVIRTEDVLLEGVGTATHIKNVNSSGQPAVLIESGRPHASRKDRQASIWRVTLSKLRLTGNEESGHGIVARFVDEIHLDAITVSYHGGDGVYLHYCYEDPRINDCLFTYNQGAGLHLVGCHDMVVSANHLEENHDGVRCESGFNLTMTGNNLDDHLGDGVVLERMMGSTVSANMIEQCAGVGIVIDDDTYGITLSANVLTFESQGGIDLRDAHGCTISGNTFSTVPRNALVIGPASDRITVSGNTFTNAYLGGGVIKTQAAEGGRGSGIVLRGTRQIAITGNSFLGLTGKALTLRGEPSSQILFCGNMLVNVTSDHEQLEDSVVANNLTTGVSTESAP